MTARKQLPLHRDIDPVTLAPLSRAHDLPGNRATIESARYAQSNTQLPCDECAAVQHETRGEFGPRMQAKVRRSIENGETLRLCRRHANAWRERDEADVKRRGA